MATYKIVSRAEWGAAAPTAALAPMTQPDGWIVHYVGGPCPQDPTFEQSAALVRRLQADAQADTAQGYIDIEYSFLIDPNGLIFEGRGWPYKSGANGSSNYNGHAWAVCLLIGPGDGKATDPNHLTQAAKDALSWLTRQGVQMKSTVSYVKGHRDVYATHCPGDEAYAFVPYLSAHLHEPPPPAIDWHFVTEAMKWQQRVARRPLWEDQDTEHPQRPLDVRFMRALLKAHGYDIDVDEVYGPKCVEFIADFKEKRGLPNHEGDNCGGQCAAELLKFKKH